MRSIGVDTLNLINLQRSAAGDDVRCSSWGPSALVAARAMWYNRDADVEMSLLELRGIVWEASHDTEAGPHRPNAPEDSG